MNPVSALRRQGSHQRRIVRLHIHDDVGRNLSVDIMLRHKSLQNLFFQRLAIAFVDIAHIARKHSLVAQMTTAAHHRQIHASPVFTNNNGDDIRILPAVRFHALLLQHT